MNDKNDKNICSECLHEIRAGFCGCDEDLVDAHRTHKLQARASEKFYSGSLSHVEKLQSPHSEFTFTIQ